MFAYVLKSAIVFLAAVAAATGGSDWSSTLVKENLSRFCPESTGQMAAHDCSDTFIRGKQKLAEDTGVEGISEFHNYRGI